MARQPSDGKQGSKDSRTKRVNFDNESAKKFDKTYEKRSRYKGKHKEKQDSRSKADRTRNNTQRVAQATDDWFAPFNWNPELVQGAARIPDSFIQGYPIPGFSLKQSVPTLMVLDWQPVFETGKMSAMTQAMNDQYSFVVHANSRNYNYSPVDLFLLELAGTQVFSAIAMGIRAYGVMNMYSAVNEVLPKALVEGMGFSFKDLRNNLSRMWLDLNQLISESTQVWLPNTFTFTSRWFRLNSEIYMDSESVKDQFYMFRQTGFYKLRLDQRKGTALDKISWLRNIDQSGVEPFLSFNLDSTDSNARTWADYLDFVRQLIEPLTQAQDRGMIYGDLLNAYGLDRMFAIAPIAFDYTTPIRNDETALTAIMNATLTPFTPNAVTQDPQKNVLQLIWDAPSTYDPPFTQYGYAVPKEAVLNFKHMQSSPTPEQIVNASRFISLGIDGNGSALIVRASGSTTGIEFAGKIKTVTVTDGSLKPAVYSSEVVNALRLITPYPATYAPYESPENNLYEYKLGPAAYYQAYDAVGTGQLVEYTLALGLTQAFDWRPICYNFSNSAIVVEKQNIPTAGTTETIYQLNNLITPALLTGELDYIVPLAAQDLKQINEVCFKSLMGVPIRL